MSSGSVRWGSRAELAWRLSPGPIPRRGSPRRPPASAAAAPPAQAQAPADHVRGFGGDTPPDRCRQARRRRACCCSWPAPGSYGAAPSQGPACPLPQSGRGAAGPPLSGQARQKRRPMHPNRARRYPSVSGWRPSRSGNATEPVTWCSAKYEPSVFPAFTPVVPASVGPTLGPQRRTLNWQTQGGRRWVMSHIATRGRTL